MLSQDSKFAKLSRADWTMNSWFEPNPSHRLPKAELRRHLLKRKNPAKTHSRENYFWQPQADDPDFRKTRGDLSSRNWCLPGANATISKMGGRPMEPGRHDPRFSRAHPIPERRGTRGTAVAW